MLTEYRSIVTNVNKPDQCMQTLSEQDQRNKQNPNKQNNRERICLHIFVYLGICREKCVSSLEGGGCGRGLASSLGVGGGPIGGSGRGGE